MLPSVVRLQELATAADSVTCEDGLQVRFRQDIGPLKRELNCSFDSALTPLELLQGFFQMRVLPNDHYGLLFLLR